MHVLSFIKSSQIAHLWNVYAPIFIPTSKASLGSYILTFLSTLEGLSFETLGSTTIKGNF